jgi:PAS domain-containing protein
LQQAVETLEERVRVRTEDLAQANLELEAEVAVRRQTEDALYESEKRYRTVVETQTEFVVRNTPDGVRTFVNQAFCRYFGLSRDEAIGKSFFELMAEEDLSRILEKYNHRRQTILVKTIFIEWLPLTALLPGRSGQKQGFLMITGH